MKDNQLLKNISIYLILLVVIAMGLKMTMPQETKPAEWTYSNFMEYVADGKIDKVTLQSVNDENYQIEGETKKGEKFTLFAPASDQGLHNILKEKNVTVDYKPSEGPPWWAGLLSTLLPVLLIAGFLFFMLQQTQGSGNRVMQFGKNRAKMLDPEKQKVTFKDVAGVDEAKEELGEVVEFLKEPKCYIDIGAKIPKGVLLYGPPGTGKTLLAKAVAGEAGVPFFSISGSDFVEMFVGVGASRVRDLFEQAKKNSPCIVFVDEIDAVGRHRGAGLGGGHDEREQTLNQLLVEMDGFDANEGIIILAATNRPDILDPALLRPGRFDRQVVVDSPDLDGRKEIIKVHARGKKLEDDIDLDVLARRTPGFTGADLANMVNEGALLAARRGKKKIGMKELEDAIERVIAGPEKKSRVMSDKEKRLVAYHEAGHAVVGSLLPNTDPVHKISIIPRGRAGGYTLMLPTEDRHYLTRSHLLDEITTLLGGRVSEDIVLKDISTGAQNDLERATTLVRKMITEYGMSEELGPLTFGRPQEQIFLGRDISRDRNYSEEVAFSIDKEARRIVEQCYQKAKQILEDNIHKLHLVATTLMEQETIEADEFEALMQGA
ncbi:MAG: ATP-dependent zinc metalloprotease FtsH [Syntrophaceticus schinkii]|nr:ATP-dependent zinc metalloprotease FtsH [Syntrophaceticus schinkii]MDD4261214.1 ATP-dependent zinc metalloprotease FtsH [Syntrophaceticus schinkii]